MCLWDEYDENLGEPAFGILRCFQHNPAPKNGSLLESRLPCEFPEKLLKEFAGKTFRVYPRQLGLSPWGAKVEIVFEEPTSVLVAAALKQ